LKLTKKTPLIRHFSHACSVVGVLFCPDSRHKVLNRYMLTRLIVNIRRNNQSIFNTVPMNM